MTQLSEHLFSSSANSTLAGKSDNMGSKYESSWTSFLSFTVRGVFIDQSLCKVQFKNSIILHNPFKINKDSHAIVSH